MWAFSLQVHAVHFASYRLKYWLLIGGIHLMCNFIVACANRQTGWDTYSVSIYGNALLSFLEWTLLTVTSYLLLLKMIIRYHSVQDWNLASKLKSDNISFSFWLQEFQMFSKVPELFQDKYNQIFRALSRISETSATPSGQFHPLYYRMQSSSVILQYNTCTRATCTTSQWLILWPCAIYQLLLPGEHLQGINNPVK